ncbi:MAG TPA: hypothetical protein VIP11_23560 [Gemmatimonadaceae bacterium]
MIWGVIAGLFVLLLVVGSWPVSKRYARIPVALSYPIWVGIFYCLYVALRR